MKTFEKINTRVSALTAALISGFVLFFAGPAWGQDPVRPMMQDTLKEAKVTARIVTTVEEIGPMRIRLNVLNPTNKPVRISILNYQNEPVFQDAFREREYNKILNFSSTVPGRYSLHVAGRKNAEVRRFEVANTGKRDMTASTLEVKEGSDVQTTIYKASPTRVMLHMVNNTGRPVEYVFRNSARDIIYQGSVRDQKFAQAFDMSQVTDGRYTVEVNYQANKAAARSFDVNTVYERSFTWTDKRGKPIKAQE